MPTPQRKPPNRTCRFDKVTLPTQTPDPPRDPHGDYKRVLRSHALQIGRPFENVLDEWAARSDAYWYAGADRDVANAVALQDMGANRGQRWR